MKRTLLRVSLTAGVLLVGALVFFALRLRRDRVVSTDVLVVGGGVSGLSAAWEAGQGGRNVVVVERNSVFGGNGVVSAGSLCIVDTPLQHSQGIQDSSALAEDDMLKWGEDSDPAWAHVYVRDSRREIYDWLTGIRRAFHGFSARRGQPCPAHS